jgi:hypothetical protein
MINKISLIGKAQPDHHADSGARKNGRPRDLRVLNAIMRSFKKLFYDENRHGISGYQFVTWFPAKFPKRKSSN